MAVNRECPNLDNSIYEVEECYTSFLFHLDGNDNPYDYDILDD